MPPFSNAIRAAAAPLLASVLLAGCADYVVRRETVSQNGGDAIATNRATQMVDPWSRASADKTIAFNGEKMQSAVERYRKNRVIQPRGMGTTDNYASQGSDPAAPPAPSPPAAPAAPVK
jgi:hypothetical protein